MSSRQLARAKTFSLVGLAVVAGAGLSACGSDAGRPSGVADTPIDAAPNDATSHPDVVRGDASTHGDASADGEAGSKDGATDASMDEAEAAEPALCLDDGGPVHLDAITAPTQVSGVCQATIRRAVATSVTAGATVRFVGLTPDARTLAWFEAGTLNYADRADANAAWGPGHSVDGVVPGPDRPALSADGLRVVVVKSDRHGFAEYTRLDRMSSRFASVASETQFAGINAVGVMLGSNEWLGSPVLSSDDHTFIYLRGEGIDQRHDAVYASTRASNITWPLGVAVHAIQLDALCGRYRRPTGLSADGLTLFYWDETVAAERATFRSAPTAAFAGSIDLGDSADAVPNAACSSLFFSVSTGGVSSAALTP